MPASFSMTSSRNQGKTNQKTEIINSDDFQIVAIGVRRGPIHMFLWERLARVRGWDAVKLRNKFNIYR
jgi:hypothetical protein